MHTSYLFKSITTKLYNYGLAGTVTPSSGSWSSNPQNPIVAGPVAEFPQLYIPSMRYVILNECLFKYMYILILENFNSWLHFMVYWDLFKLRVKCM